MRAAGAKSWDQVKTGTAASAAVRVTGEEGLTYEFRVEVVVSESSTTPKHSILACRTTPAGSPGPHSLGITVTAGTGFVIGGIVLVG